MFGSELVYPSCQTLLSVHDRNSFYQKRHVIQRSVLNNRINDRLHKQSKLSLCFFN
jgi:hypothetical protein